MHTPNFGIDLMVPLQINKDVIFNEAIIKLDSFCNISISGFIQNTPEELIVGEKYIITDGEHINNICYKPLQSKPILLHQPLEGMLVFIRSDHSFWIFTEASWQKITTHTKDTLKFTGISEQFSLPTDTMYNYLYLNADTNLNITEINFPEVNIVIKQSCDKICSIEWPKNIIWLNNITHQMTTTQNVIDFIKLFRLPETNHLLGQIIGQNCEYSD
ncbi:MAG: hypothetical protein AB8B66_02035 [Rickettsiaceae bacterium]